MTWQWAVQWAKGVVLSLQRDYSCGEDPLSKLPQRDPPVEQDTQRGIGTAPLNRYFEISLGDSGEQLKASPNEWYHCDLTSFLISQYLKGKISVRENWVMHVGRSFSAISIISVLRNICYTKT